MPCYITDSRFMVHKYEVGEDVKFEGNFWTVVEVNNHKEIDREKGVLPEYRIFDGQNYRNVKEDALEPATVEVEAESVEVVNR